MSLLASVAYLIIITNLGISPLFVCAVDVNKTRLYYSNCVIQPRVRIRLLSETHLMPLKLRMDLMSSGRDMGSGHTKLSVTGTMFFLPPNAVTISCKI